MGSSHSWKFFRAGAFDQVRLSSGADLASLDHLDQKLWVALACPTTGLEFDSRTLALIDAIERLPGARFVRNDKEYAGPAAAKHLRSKWTWQRSSIKTARDFIRLAATSSSQTGRPYLIRFADGRVMKSADFLGNELDRLEGKGPGK